MSTEQNDNSEYPYSDEDEHLYGTYHIVGHFEELYDKPLETLGLSPPAFNSLKRYGLTAVGDVLDMVDVSAFAMITIRSYPEGVIEEIIAKLKEHGYIR